MAEKPADNRPSIGLEKDGPLKVTGLETFLNSRGERIATKKTIFLCRCGASKNKPFCDGAHAQIGFTDEKSDDRMGDKLETYEGREVTMLDNRGVCSHAGYCTSGLPAVWRSAVEPWIDPDGAGKQEIVDTIRKCPSGALSYLEDGQAQTAFHDSAEIQVSRDGPYYVRGGVELEGATFGEGASREHYVLCRCGASRNKPFCDGSHWYAGFHDDEALTISKAAKAQEAGEETWVAIGKAEDFAEGQVEALTVGEKQAAVVRVEGQLYALDGRCPHQGGPLGEGNLCEGALRCPWHGYDFDLKTGKGRGNEHSVEALKIREEGGQVEIALPKPKRSEWTVSHVIAETLVEWGVDSVFGMVGHSNLGMAEALRILEGRGKLRFFGIRHEGAAAFACSGYAKVTGRPAACLSIAGPGATNLLTGLWDAKVDRAPVIALTGQVQTQVMGPGAFQDIDLASAFEAVARFSQTVLPGSDSRRAGFPGGQERPGRARRGASDLRTEGRAENGPAVGQHVLVDLDVLVDDHQRRARAQREHDSAIHDGVRGARIAFEQPCIEVVRRRTRRDDQLTVGRRAHRGEHRGEHETREDARQQVHRRQHQAEIAPVRSVQHARGPGDAIDGQRAGHQSDGHGPPVDETAPHHGDDARDGRIATRSQRHEAHEHVRLSGIAEVDAQGPVTEQETEQREPGLVRRERQQRVALRQRAQLRPHEVEAAMVRQQIDREYDQGADHQQGLQKVGPAHGTKPTDHGVQQHHDAPDENADLVVDVKAGRERLAGRGQLGGDVQQHGHQDDDDGQHADQRRAFLEMEREEIGQGQGFQRVRTIAQTPGQEEPVEHVSQQAARNDPVRLHAGGKGPTDQTECHPARFARRGCTECRNPGPRERPARK